MTKDAKPRPGLRLRNRYLVLRHGRSLANEQSLIVSSPRLGLNQFGLSDVGRQQVKASLRERLQMLESVQQIYTSDFLRARETAEIAADFLGVGLELAAELRERDFGDWDGQSSTNYDLVWQADAKDPTHRNWNVESVTQVVDRCLRLITSLEQTTTDSTYLLVSHGDPLQILLTRVAGEDLRHHRKLRPLETAEIRSLL